MTAERVHEVIQRLKAPALSGDDLARVEAEREQELSAHMTEWKSEQARIALERKVLAAQIPEHAGLRLVACSEDPIATPAMSKCLQASAWRDARTAEVAAKLGAKAGSWPALLFLSGAPDSGKSCAMAWTAVHHPARALFVTAAEIAATAFGHSETTEQWREWYDVDLLCIDELGLERGEPDKLARVLVERYNRGRFTLCAGNLTLEEFQGRYNPGEQTRLWSRLEREQGQLAGGLPWYVLLEPCDLRGKGIGS